MLEELWKQAEKLVAKYFNLQLTSGSGRGHDKGDQKDADWIVETKSFSGKSYSLNYEKFNEWRAKAALRGKSFFLVTVPVIDKQLSEANMLVTIEAPLFRAILRDINKYVELQEAVKEHAEQLLDDRCFLDDLKLYKLVGIEDHPGLEMPKEQFLNNCSKYWECQQLKKAYLPDRPVCDSCGSIMVCTNKECG